MSLTRRSLPVPVLPLLLMAGAVQGSGPDITIPESGVYIACFTCDPHYSLQTRLKINHVLSDFICYGQNKDIGGLTVAVPLSKGDQVSYWKNRELPHPATATSITLVGSDKSNYLTVQSRWQDKFRGTEYVKFFRRYASDGKWQNYHTEKTHFTIPKTGMYYVMARPDCDDGWASLQIGDDIFRAYCGDDQPWDASGAFLLQRGTKLYMKFIGGRNSRIVESATLFSYVYLQNNYQPSTRQYVAYTAMANKVGFLRPETPVSFGGRLMTHQGLTWNANARTWTIQVAGTYIVSVRSHPYHGGDCRFNLFRNDVQIYSYYAEDGTLNGQSRTFVFSKGDFLELYPDWDRRVGKDMMISIALLNSS